MGRSADNQKSKNSSNGFNTTDVTSLVSESTLKLIKESSMIFQGALIRKGASNMSVIPGNENIAIVKVGSGLRVDPGLGDIKGKEITIAMQKPNALALNKEAIFFTNAWIHGDGISVTEVAHLETDDKKNNIGVANKILEVIRRLPEAYLKERIQVASLIVLGEILRITKVENQRIDRDAPIWAKATIRVEDVLKGKVQESEIYLFFPTSISRRWYNSPRFTVGQRGIFIIQPTTKTYFSEPSQAGLAILTALNPLEFQPEQQLELIKNLLTN